MIGIADIEAARERIAGRVRRTPVMALDQLQTPVEADRVSLKLECLQVTGSFKARGAMSRYMATPKEEMTGGLVTASGGNHGLAVARTAYVAGVPATIFVPSAVSPAKVEKMHGWKARVEIVGDTFDEANAAALAFAEEGGAKYLHPFADPYVMAGQGTLGLEILEDLPDMDAIIIAIGGGGLISGLATAIRALRPGVRIIGVEPTGSPTIKTCMEAGKLVALDKVTSRVPTMTCKQTDQLVVDTVMGKVDEFVLVEDDEMAEAARWLWFEMGVAADLSGAASLAALRKFPQMVAGSKHVCALVCGAGPEGTVQA